MKKAVLPSIFIAVLSCISYAQVPDLYLGLTPPGNTPEVFAPGIVSLPSRNERVITFSPSGHEIFFAIGDWPTRKTMYIQYKDGVWTDPELASFSIGSSAEEPFFSADGSRVYYYAYPPASTANADIYYSSKTDTGWSEPVNLGSTLNTTGDEYHPNVVADGSIYFANTSGKTYRSQYSNGSFQPRVLLPNNVNSGVWPDHYVAQDESYMIFTSSKAGGYGSSDLYISFRNADGSWTNPQNLGSPINTAAYEGSADITPDGLYMTFDNSSDIYWVKIDNVIDSLEANSGVVTSVNELPNQQDFNIFPNPGNGLFQVLFAANQDATAELEIRNTGGNVIYRGAVKNADSIDLTAEPQGMYFVKVITEHATVVKKVCMLK